MSIKDEHILMLLAGVALVALLVYKFAPGLIGGDDSNLLSDPVVVWRGYPANRGRFH